MKRKISILAVLVLSVTLSPFAQSVRTVSNHPVGGAQYADLTAAYDASVTGDTLLIEGTSTTYSYNTTSFGKELVVIGQGYNTQKQVFFPTMIGRFANVTAFNFTTGANGSKFYGINFSNAGPINISASDMLFENCLFDRQVNISGGNNTFINCVFTIGDVFISSSSSFNTLALNCIINNRVTGTGNSLGITLDHCLFLSTGACFNNSSSYIIKNCIFMNSTGLSGITGSLFQNNLYRVATTFPPAGNTDAGGNITGNPLFVNYTFNNLYSTSHDYHTQAGSPALGAASDATDIGLHGGVTKYSEKGEPLNAPVMRSMDINNPVVQANGTLNVNITASKPNDN